jgi:hypothetical protein
MLSNNDITLFLENPAKVFTMSYKDMTDKAVLRSNLPSLSDKMI